MRWRMSIIKDYLLLGASRLRAAHLQPVGAILYSELVTTVQVRSTAQPGAD